MIVSNITGKTRLLGLIGDPIEHSISPQLHNTLCKLLDIDEVYLPFRVSADRFEKIVEGFRGLNIVGFNVTIPYKVEIMKFLDHISEEALLMGAVNTVKVVDKKLYGFNTDGQGFIRALKNTGFNVENAKAVILGAGGAARAVGIKLAQERIKKLVILNRSKHKAEELAHLINTKIKNIAIPAEATYNNIIDYSADCDIVINTTPVGMWPDVDESPFETPEIFRNKPFVYDLIYNPLKTKFLSVAEEYGCKILNGLEMLIYQGISAFEIWNELSVSEGIIQSLINEFKEYLNKKV